ncbi:MAG: hypothetical protein D6732_16350 [Methanobacteriota archaeon]|nr:MAG: hypothetical protein D6732_16350 [Euryarchaeota archaeon]
MRRLRCVVLISLVVFFCTSVFSQNETTETPEKVTRQERPAIFDVDLQKAQRTNEQIIPQAQLLEQAFETAVDSTAYILGPGDQLLVKIWGTLDEQFVTSITPEGYMIIPSVAEVKVSGMTLAEASDLIKSKLRGVFKNSQFSIRLVRLRKFRVHVVGEVETPGTYYVRAVDRVSDVLQLAGGISTWGDDTRIQIRHLNNQVEIVNINEFLLTGHTDQNPFLTGGDIVYVPSIDLTGQYVIVEGNVGSQGIYQLQSGETLLSFLSRVRSLNRQSDIEHVVLIRGNERESFNLLDPNFNRDMGLQSGDRIVVPTNRNQVYVRGEVREPGAFPYLANYTAMDYAGLAGILETAKGLDALIVIHSETGEVEKGRNVIVHNGDIVVVPRRARESFKDILSILTPILSIGLSAYAVIQASK